jgi:uncharacterized protein
MQGVTLSQETRPKERTMKRSVAIVILLSAGAAAQAQNPPVQGPPPATPPAQAAPQTPPAKVDPAKEADIRKLLEISGSAKLSEEMVAASSEQLKANAARSLPPGDQSQKILDSLMRRYKAKFTIEQLNALIIPIYDKYLTDEDIKGLIDFYQTPLGQRVVKALPMIGRESQAAAFELNQTVVQQVVKEVQDEFPQLKQGNPPDRP